MVATQGIRSGSRAKFSNPTAIKAAMDTALGNGNDFVLTHTPPAVAKTERDIVVATVRPTVTSASCVRALERAIGFGKSALYLEVAVALAVFASSSTGADRSTKRVVMEIYTQAGFDTRLDGEDYKTVNRRINASAAFFNKIGKDAIDAAAAGLREGKAIDAISTFLSATFNFSGVNAVLEFAGKPVKQTNTPEYRASRLAGAGGDDKATAVGIGARMDARRLERQAEDDSDGTIVSAGKLSLVVPGNCTAAEVRAMSVKLAEFADRMEAEMGTPEEQRNREMHS